MRVTCTWLFLRCEAFVLVPAKALEPGLDLWLEVVTVFFTTLSWAL